MDYNELMKAIMLIDKYVIKMKSLGKTPIQINNAKSSLSALRKISIDFAINGKILEINAMNGNNGVYWTLVDHRHQQRAY
ncbi:MAG: hypothetical protein H6622_11705 [Halobacteriovoraceae bacterium]|nr:hypothetical protein [Halobacteriovoraceae bacterium]